MTKATLDASMRDYATEAKAEFERLRAAGPERATMADYMADHQAKEQAKVQRLLMPQIAEHRGKADMDADLFMSLTAYTGRVWGPQCLMALDGNQALHPDAYPAIVAYVWGLAEYPGLSMSNTAWMRLWAKAGFTVNGAPGVRPTTPLTLWRAAWPKHRKGMSWTDQREVAEHFLTSRHGDTRLYTATVEPRRLLAFIHEDGRHEHEWVVNTRALTITEEN